MHFPIMETETLSRAFQKYW